MEILVDTREHKRIKEIQEYYNSLENVTCNVTKLETGDFIFSDRNGSVCFEWKLIPDFIASIKNKRVFNQSIDMYTEFQYHYVIIVGSELELENCFISEGLAPNAYYAAIAKLNTYTTVINAPDNMTGYQLMLCQAEKCLEDNFIYKRLPIKTPNPAQNLLLLCNYIGDETVILLKEELDIYSFKDLQRISYEDLTSIKGIGHKTATMILEYIDKQLQ